MTTIIIVNAVLGAAVLATILSVIGWAIKTQRRDHVPALISVRSRRTREQVVARRQAAGRRRQAAQLFG